MMNVDNPPAGSFLSEVIDVLRANLWLTIILLTGLTLPAPLRAEAVALHDGTRLEGKLVPIAAMTQRLEPKRDDQAQSKPILMIDTGMQQYFVPARQVDVTDRDVFLQNGESFAIPQTKQRGSLTPTTLGRYESTPFDEYGRRRVTVSTERGPIHIIQGITEITPRQVKIIGLTHKWELSIATTSLPEESLDQILRRVNDPTNPDHRLSLARFYLEAGNFIRASAELDGIGRDFPELRERVAQINDGLVQNQAKELLIELRRLKKVGQHQLAYVAARNFPRRHLKVEALREVDDLIRAHTETRDKIDLVISELSELQAQLTKPEEIQALEPMRAVVREELGPDSLSRMSAFITLQADESLRPEDKLALAYSGWILGGDHAVTDLAATMRYWQGRHLVLAYLRSDNPDEQSDLLAQLHDLEGFSPDVLGYMVPLLPMLTETPDAKPGQAFVVEARTEAGAEPVKYQVLLPREYNPQRSYPMVLALHAGGENGPAASLKWWGGTAEAPLQSQRRGYIVIAPEYLKADQKQYDYSAAAHQLILNALRDARHRFNVDSDRVFLSGHGIGGDAAWDIGLSHPDLFAGIVPICGIADGYAKWYWTNAKDLPIYSVNGELDRQSLEQNAREVNRMMRAGYKVIYTQYVGRGYESYYEEIHKIFDWMDFQKRNKLPKEFDMRILRPADNSFYWAELEGLPANIVRANPLDKSGGGVSPMPFTLEVKDGAEDYTAIYARSGAARTTLWLSPEMISFDKRLKIRGAGVRGFNDFVRKDMRVMLDDLQRRGDRQMLFWAKVVVD